MNDNTIFKNESHSGYLAPDNSVVLVNFVINAILILKAIVGKSLVQIAARHFEDPDTSLTIHNAAVQFGCFRTVS